MEKVPFPHNNWDHVSMVPLQYRVSVCKQPQGGCITSIPGVSSNKRVLALRQSKQETKEIPSTLYQQFISPPGQASHSSPPDELACPITHSKQSPKVTWCWQMSLVMTVTATIKLTTSIITIMFAPKGTYTQRACFFFFYKYKEIHRMILYTTYNKYCVSYILLFERMYVGFCLWASFFSRLRTFFYPGLWTFFSFM